MFDVRAKLAVLVMVLSPFIVSGALGGRTLGQANPAVDSNGDPLPSGALARLGTTRFRFDGAAHLEFAPDGNSLFLSTLDQRVVEWDFTTARQRARLFEGPFGSTTADNPYRIASNALSPDAKNLAQEAINADGRFHSAIRLWDTVSGKELRSFGSVGRVKWTPKTGQSNKLLLAVHEGGKHGQETEVAYSGAEGPGSLGGG